MPTLSFTQVTGDLNRPGSGANQWSYGQNIINIPTQGTNTQRLNTYWRFLWNDFQACNGAQGLFSFAALDAQFQDAINKKQRISFGIMQHCDGCDANLLCSALSGGNTFRMAYPVWLHNQMQAEAVKDFTSGGAWVPNYNSVSWLNAWKALNVAVNAHIMSTTFNGVRYQDIVDFVDVRGYGNFGEWTNNDFSGPSGTVATDATLTAIIDAVVTSFPTFQCVALIAMFDGNQLPNTKVSPAVGYHALTVANSVAKLGWRRDNWGQTDGYISQWTDSNPTTFNGLQFNTEIMNRWKLAPIVGEPQDQGSAGRFVALPTQINTYHGNSFGNGNFNDSSNATNATTQANFRAASANCGARFTLTGGNITTNSITLNWSNIGINPCYGFWNPTLEFRVGASVIATKVVSFTPHMFMPGTAVSNDSLSTVPNGTYDVYLLMKDAVGFQFPMPLFITGVKPDGGYLLASGVVISNAPTTTTTTTSTTTHTTTSTSTSSTTSHSTTSTTTLSTTSTSSTTTTTHSTTSTSSTTTSTSTTTTTTRVPPPGISIITNQVPPTTTLNDGTPLELGVRFRSSIGGVITGIRFWKTNTNTGTHIGELYSNAGVRLATATFTGETPNQWQYVLFTNPVPIQANTTYVAAYFSPTGNYIATNLAFQGKTIVNPPLTMLADGTDGSNGIYRYNATPIFPNATFQSSNYWVDVVFNTTTSTTTTSTSTSSTTTRSTTSTSSTTTSTTTHTTTSTSTTTSSTTTSTTTHSTTSTTTSSTTTTTTTIFVPPPTTTTTSTTSTTTTTSSTTTSSTSTTTSTTHSTTSTSTTSTTTRPTTTTTSTSTSSSSTTSTTTQAPTTSTSTTSTTTIHVNQPPVADAGGDQIITLPVDHVLLNGSGSTDDGTIVSYLWDQLNGPSQAVITAVGVAPTPKATAEALVAGIYTFELRVADNAGLIGVSTMNVTVKARNEDPPRAFAYGSVPPNAQPGTITADGSQSTGNNLSYAWTQVKGPTALIIANSSVITNIILPLYGSYTFGLTVTDDENRSASTQLAVSIEQDFNPTTINFNT